jgi:hypothetical protein
MKWIGQSVYDFISRFRNDVYLENIQSGTIASGGNLGLDSNNKIVKAAEATGDITGVALTAGTGIDLTSVANATGGDYAATIGVDVSDFMSGGSSGRVLTSDSADSIRANNYLSFTAAEGEASILSIISNEDTGDRCVISTTTHGATTLTTTDDDATAAHFEVAADGDITLDAAGQIKLEPATGNNILLDGTVTVDGGSVTGITTLGVDSVSLTAVQTSGESFADNDTSIMTSAAIDDRINSADATIHATAQTGKNYRIVNTSFRADIGTTKYYLPLKSQDEQTVLTREENQEVAVCDGRLVSLTWRAEAFNTHTGDATVTFGVETNTVGSSYSGGYSVQETESVTVNHADDQHLWHVVFDSAKHWDSTDMFTISMQSDTDITGSNERIFITLVIEDDWSTYLAGSTREIDSTP